MQDHISTLARLKSERSGLDSVIRDLKVQRMAIIDEEHALLAELRSVSFDPEVPPANQNLSTLKAERARVESAILGPKAARQDIVGMEHALNAELHLCKGVLSLIRRMPPEILAEIFAYFTPVLDVDRFDVLQAHVPTAQDPFYPRAEIPWYLGHICRSWRAVALSMRSLWSTFDLQPRSSVVFERRVYFSYLLPRAPGFEFPEQKMTTELTLASLRHCLERSNGAAIAARIVYQGNTHTTALLDLFAGISQRLDHLVLVGFPAGLLWSLYISCASYNQLRRLTIISAEFPNVFSFVELLPPPLLTELVVTHMHFIDSTDPFTIPWHQLTTYHEANCVWDTQESRWMSYRRLSDVTDLSIRFSLRRFDGPETVLGGPVLLPQLRHAQFLCGSDQSILHSFDMPVLETLVYFHADHRFHPNDTPPTILLPGLSHHLRILRIRVTGDPASTRSLSFVDILGAAPQLVELSISIPNLQVDDFVTSLLPFEPELDEPVLGAKLEMVQLANSIFDDYDHLVEMLECRFGSQGETVTRMRSFHLSNPQPYSQEMVEASKVFREQGWDVVCDFRNPHDSEDEE
ncbi:hypothetical protein C8R46DRAFT_1227825 [Mycena filopes]|nr:hypothetical protein C8R46DRAFT_1227825 [Mycena filopes]